MDIEAQICTKETQWTLWKRNFRKNSSWSQTEDEPEGGVVGHEMTVQRLSATESDINLGYFGYIRLCKASSTSFPDKDLLFTSFPHLLCHPDALSPGITLCSTNSQFLNKWNKWSSSMEKLMSMPRSLYPQLSSSLLSYSRTFFLT